MTAFWGEVVGTAILLFLGGSVCAGTSLKKSFAYNSGWLVIHLVWGLAVTIAIFTVGKYSGAHLNPVFTLVFAFSGNFPWNQVPSWIPVVGPILGGCLGGFFYNRDNARKTHLSVFFMNMTVIKNKLPIKLRNKAISLKINQCILQIRQSY